MPDETKERRHFIRDYQLRGGTYERAVEIWNASQEIADSFRADGVTSVDQLSEGEIADALAVWRAVRETGL